MDIVWIGAAFALGLLASLFRLPPLVGYLAAGFLLHALGVELSETLEHFADIGLTLLLFSIGLKLRPRSLLSPSVWGTTVLHMALVTAISGAALFGLSQTGLLLFAGLTREQCALLGFALSFSSTIFAVKGFEERATMNSRHGRTALGILVIQDLVAVAFLAIAAGKAPSLWAVLLLGLLPLRWLIGHVLDHLKHGELLVLGGLAIALGGAALFEFFDVKGDLGALCLGLLLGGHPRSRELGKALYSVKDLFLVGFFLSVGMVATPTVAMFSSAAALSVLVPLKLLLFFFLLTRFRVPAGDSFRASLSLANFSEFGLIVAAVGFEKGWLPASWLGAMAMAVSLLFVLGAPAAQRSDNIWERLQKLLSRFERPQPAAPGLVLGEKIEALILGMGRVGSGAYDELERELGPGTVLGVDVDSKVLERQRTAGRRMIRGDMLDPDFYDQIGATGHPLRLILLAPGVFEAKRMAARRLRLHLPDVHIAAASRHPDQGPILEDAGVDYVFDLYTRAGVGLALQAMANTRADPDHSLAKAAEPVDDDDPGDTTPSGGLPRAG